MCKILIVGHAGSGTTLCCERLSKRGECVVWNDFHNHSANQRTCEWAGIEPQEPGPITGWDWWGIKDPSELRWDSRITEHNPQHILVLIREPHETLASTLRRGYRSPHNIKQDWKHLVHIAGGPDAEVVKYTDLVRPGFEFPTWQSGWHPDTADGAIGHFAGPLQASELLEPRGTLTNKSVNRWEHDSRRIQQEAVKIFKETEWVYDIFGLNKPDLHGVLQQ